MNLKENFKLFKTLLRIGKILRERKRFLAQNAEEVKIFGCCELSAFSTTMKCLSATDDRLRWLVGVIFDDPIEKANLNSLASGFGTSVDSLRVLARVLFSNVSHGPLLNWRWGSAMPCLQDTDNFPESYLFFERCYRTRFLRQRNLFGRVNPLCNSISLWNTRFSRNNARRI